MTDKVKLIRKEKDFWHDASEDVGTNERILVFNIEDCDGTITTRERLVRGYGEWGKGFDKWCYLDDILTGNKLKEVFVIERMIAPGVWELMSNSAFTDEVAANDLCLSCVKRMRKTDKSFYARVTKLQIKED